MKIHLAHKLSNHKHRYAVIVLSQIEIQVIDLFHTPCIFFIFSERNVSDYALINVGVDYFQVSKNKTERVLEVPMDTKTDFFR